MQPLALVVFGLALAAGFAAVAERVACRSPKSMRTVLLGGVALLAGAILAGQVLPFLRLDRLYTPGTILAAALWSLSFVAGGLGVVMLAGASLRPVMRSRGMPHGRQGYAGGSSREAWRRSPPASA